MAFSLLGDQLQRKVKKESPLQKQLDASAVVEYANAALEELFGKDQAIHAKPLFLKNRTLTISCVSSIIAQEIRLNQKKLVDLINNKIGKKEIDRIRYLA